MAGVMSGASPWRHVRLGDLTPTIEHRGDGTVIPRAANARRLSRVLTDRLVHWASHAPDRTLLAWRLNGSFERLSTAKRSRKSAVSVRRY